MQRKLTEKQKIRGKEHIANAIDYLQHVYGEILRLKKYQSKIGCYTIFKNELLELFEELKEAKERVAKLQRKYI